MDQTALYHALAASLMAICPQDFTRAEIVADLSSGYSKIVYSCETASGPKKGLDSPMDVDMKVDSTLHALRDGMTQDQRAPWSSCTFTLFPDGEFKFDVSYDD